VTYEELQAELVQSMKDKNRVRKNVIAGIMTLAKNMAIEAGVKDNIAEDIVTAAILKNKKMCQESIDMCPENRSDMLEALQVTMGYINEFAPKMMTEDEIRKFVEEELIEMTQVYTLSPKIKGLVMKTVMTELKGKADGKLINKVVTELLN
jgi:hypothetical protein